MAKKSHKKNPLFFFFSNLEKFKILFTFYTCKIGQILKTSFLAKVNIGLDIEFCKVEIQT